MALGGLGGWFANWRNRRLADPAFQDWASRSWLTRAKANAEAGRMLDIAVGFAYARTLSACVGFDLFERLRAGPQAGAVLAQQCQAPEARFVVLLKAAAALDLLEPAGPGLWRLGPLGASLLGNPGVAAMIAHHSLLYDDLRYDAAGNPGAAGPYSALMAATQTMIARQIVAAYPLRRYRHLVDVGGGEGVFVRAALSAAPHLSATVVDLPAVAARAAELFAQIGLGARATVAPATAPGDGLPPGADLISFVRVLHDHDDPAVMRFLTASAAALAPGGRILIAEPLADTTGARAMGHAYFGLYLLAMGQGRPRTRRELAAMLRAAGFKAVREHRAPQPALVRLLSARL
jgi:demethylspheroidene O-methyltransferase